MIKELPSESGTENVAYRRDSYGGDHRFKVIRFLAGAGQGYVLQVEDTWCGGNAVLKGMWWRRHELAGGAWERRLRRNTGAQQAGLNAIYQAVQRAQAAPAVIEVLQEASPTLEANGLTPEAETFVVMEYVGVEGQPVRTLHDEIQDRARERRPFSEEDLIDLAEQLCQALGALHTRRQSATPGQGQEYWVHADLKPHNVIMLGPPAQYILIDYDAAVKADSPIGTTTDPYAPPRPQAARSDDEWSKASERFDIYMLGMTLAHALMLERPDERLKQLFHGTLADHGQAKQQLATRSSSPIITTLIGSCLSEEKTRARDVHSILADLARARDTVSLRAALMEGL